MGWGVCRWRQNDDDCASLLLLVCCTGFVWLSGGANMCVQIIGSSKWASVEDMRIGVLVVV